MDLIITILTAVITGIVRFFSTVFNPVWIAQTFAALFRPSSNRGNTTSVAEDQPQPAVKRKQSKFIGVVAVLVMIGSLISIFATKNRFPVPNHQPFVGLGQGLGEETVKALGNKGRVVIVISDDYNNSGSPLKDELVAFRGVLKNYPNINITDTEVIPLERETRGFSFEMFNQLVTKHAHANGLVFFTALPPLGSKLPPVALPGEHPQIIAVQTMPSPLKLYFERQIVNVLITRRDLPVMGNTGEPKTPREWFDRNYLVITAQNYATLPFQTK